MASVEMKDSKVSFEKQDCAVSFETAGRQQAGGTAAAGGGQTKDSKASFEMKESKASFSPGTRTFTPKLRVGFLIASE